MFSFLSETWTYLPTVTKATWAEIAASSRITPSNAFFSHNLKRWTHFRFPQIEPHLSESSFPSEPLFTVEAGGISSISAYSNVDTRPNVLGIALFLDIDDSAVPSLANCVGLARICDNSSAAFRLFPVPPGSYYLFFSAFNIDGVIGASHPSKLFCVT
jgi:hypothetical protein